MKLTIKYFGIIAETQIIKVIKGDTSEGKNVLAELALVDVLRIRN